MRSISLRIRLIILIFLVALPALGLAAYSAINMRRDAVTHGQEELERISYLLAKDVGNLLDNPREILSSIACTPALQGGDFTTAQPYLTRVLKDHPSLSAILATGVDGKVVASAAPLGTHPDLSDREYWSRLLATRDYVVGEYAIGRVSGLPVLTVAHPIIDEDGRFLGGLTAGLKLDYLAELGEQAELPEGAVLTVIDRAGVILARYPDSEGWVGRDLAEADLLRTINTQGEGVAEVTGLDGVKRLYAFHRALSPSAGVSIAVGIPRSTLHASANDLASTNALGLGLVAILVSWVGWFGAGALVLKPVDGVAAAARRLADGDLSARSGQSATRGELGRLACAFDEMAETIAERTSGLQAAEARYRTLVDTTPDYIYSLDLEGRHTAVNRAVCEALGLPPEEILGKTHAELGFPADVVEEWRALHRQVYGGRVVTTETATPMPDGSVHTYEVVLRPIQDGDGGVRGIRGMSRDVTDRQRAAAALAESEERFRVLVESSPNAIAVHAEGRIVYINPAGAALLGAESPQEIIGRQSLDFVHPDHREAVLRRAASVIRDQEVAPLLEEKYLRLDGTEVDVEVVAMPFSYRGQPAVNTIIRDISAKKAAERALKAQDEELRQSQRMEAIGRLAGGVAHDFNNLLTAIVGHADLLQADLDPATPSQEDVAEIRKAADRAAALTRQLLAFSRRQALQPHVFDLNVVSSSLAGLLKRLIGEDIHLVFRQTPALWPVEADPGQIEQVLMNLVINARDAMPRGGKITIETANAELDEGYISTHLSAQTGPHVMLAVTDTGTGIAEEALPHIFEPFFTTKEQGKGTGLGLSTVHGIVKQSGGNIWVYSEPGQGTTFKIYLPRTGKAVDWAPVDTHRKATGGVEPGHECVLVVEDEPAVRSLAARILRTGGYRVLEAGSSEEGLAAAAAHQGAIDLLLTDVILPGMNGRELAEALAERQQTPAAVLFMSGYTKNAIVHDGRLDEGIDFLEKPFSPEALLRKIREVLDRSGGGRAELPG
ncbi:MAG: PAS domain S-box protein [Thermoleophilia bacterium]